VYSVTQPRLSRRFRNRTSALAEATLTFTLEPRIEDVGVGVIREVVIEELIE